jgi:hypothetical protein
MGINELQRERVVPNSSCGFIYMVFVWDVYLCFIGIFSVISSFIRVRHIKFKLILSLIIIMCFLLRLYGMATSIPACVCRHLTHIANYAFHVNLILIFVSIFLTRNILSVKMFEQMIIVLS